MLSLRTPTLAFVTIISVLAVSLFHSPAASQQSTKKPVKLDGLVALAGVESYDESVATPILISDVAFFAKLINLNRYGPQAKDRRPTERDFNQARRIAVLINLLGKTAKQLGEKPSNTLIENTQRALTEMAGGPLALSEIRNQLGISREDVLGWIVNLALVQVLMKYEIDRLEPPAGPPQGDQPSTAAMQAGSIPDHRSSESFE